MLRRLQKAYDSLPRRERPHLTNSISRVVMSEKRMRDLIRDGFGEGRGEFYRPWIRVTRSVTSPISHVNVFACPVHARGIHLLSKLERTACYVACWLGAKEIREQFPLFPWQGIHPMAGVDADRDRKLGRAPSLQRVGDDIGVDIGRYVGSAVPFVATTDLVLQVGDYPNDRLAFWSVKPLKDLLCPKRGPAVRARIELERRYAKQVDALHNVFTDGTVNDHLRKNLIWLMPCREHLRANPPPSRAPFLEQFARQSDATPLNARLKAIATALDRSLAQVVAQFNTAAWLGEIDIDLTVPLTMAYPIRRDIRGRKAALQHNLTGSK